MRFALTLLACLALAACDTVSPDSVQGTYDAVVFQEVAPADGGVDVLALGGHLRLNLSPNGRFETFVMRPASGDGEPVHVYVSGAYRVDGRLVTFVPDEETPALGWVNEATIRRGGERLETADLPGHGAPFKIVLDRMSLICATGLGE